MFFRLRSLSEITIAVLIYIFTILMFNCVLRNCKQKISFNEIVLIFNFQQLFYTYIIIIESRVNYFRKC